MNQSTIELKGLALYARHGVLKEEARLGQRFIIDVALYLVDGLSFESDQTDSTVDYTQAYAEIKDAFEGTRYNLIEAAAEAIAKRILERFEKVQSVSVKVKKPAVPVDCICDYFSAEVTQCR